LPITFYITYLFTYCTYPLHKQFHQVVGGGSKRVYKIGYQGRTLVTQFIVVNPIRLCSIGPRGISQVTTRLLHCWVTLMFNCITNIGMKSNSKYLGLWIESSLMYISPNHLRNWTLSQQSYWTNLIVAIFFGPLFSQHSLCYIWPHQLEHGYIIYICLPY
jgi:hypothetical protein